MMPDRSFCPKLARKARLRKDRFGDGYLLLVPERGLRLDPIGAAIVEKLDGAHSIAAVAQELAAEYPDTRLERVEHDVTLFVAELGERGVLERQDGSD